MQCIMNENNKKPEGTGLNKKNSSSASRNSSHQRPVQHTQIMRNAAHNTAGEHKARSADGRTAVHTRSSASDTIYSTNRSGENHHSNVHNNSKKKHHKENKILAVLRKFITIILTTLLSLFLIMVITGTIVGTALTVYVLDFMEESTTGVTFQELEQGYNTYFYANDSDTGELVQLNVIEKTDVQRISVDIEDIPQHVRDAFVYTEDERFYTHDGVDYKRTLSAFLNMFFHIYDTDQGGSTITQQLVKNLTGDDEKSPSRKIREIFRAMQLEKMYSKDEILEQYLNYIGFGGPINGIQLASIRYFGKDVSELSYAEAATLAAIPKSPNYYYPFSDEVDGKANNKERQKYVLWQMYKNGAITYDEYQQSLYEKLIYTDSEEYLKLHPEDVAKKLEEENKTYSWPVEVAIDEVAAYLCEVYNINEAEAVNRINKGGYQIYLTVDLNMQKYVDERFSDINNLMNPDLVRRFVDLDGDGVAETEELAQAGFVAMNYKGEILAVGGAIGEKTGKRVFNYATGDQRQIGSTIKPISTYGLALLNDTIHWGSVYTDKAYMEVNGKPWPTNYSTDGSFSVSGAPVFVYKAVEKSYNTVPAKICQDLTPNAVFKFCTENLGMELDPSDELVSPLSVGALTYGISVENLVNAYLPYGNDGTYYKAHIVSRVEQGNHNLVYENNGDPHTAVDSETAWVMNRLLKNVVESGTGKLAKLKNKEVCGKTGTTDEWTELAFVGLTPDFVSGTIIGFKDHTSLKVNGTTVNSAQVWKNMIGEYADSLDTGKEFEAPEGVTAAPMCSQTGKIASSSCPHGVMGYWKSSNAPVCTGGHYTPPAEPTTDANGENANSGNNNTENNGNNTQNNNAGENNQQQQQQQPQQQQPQQQQPADNGGGDAGQQPAA